MFQCAHNHTDTQTYVLTKFSEISFISLVKFQIFQKCFNYVHGVNKWRQKNTVKALSPWSTVVVLKFSLQKTQPN